METISIKNWEKYQHYKDRNPPWIKFYHSLLDDYEYSCLQDASKLLLMSLYLLASRTENKIPADPTWIKQKAMLQGKVDLNPLISAGFVSMNGNASKVLAKRYQDAIPETETETEKSRDILIRFEAFWKAYPKKKSKSDALKAWKKIKPTDELLAIILKALEWQCKSEDWTKESGKFIPFPQKYLNQCRWEDEPDGNNEIRKRHRDLFCGPDDEEDGSGGEGVT